MDDVELAVLLSAYAQVETENVRTLFLVQLNDLLVCAYAVKEVLRKA